MKKRDYERESIIPPDNNNSKLKYFTTWSTLNDDHSPPRFWRSATLPYKRRMSMSAGTLTRRGQKPFASERPLSAPRLGERNWDASSYHSDRNAPLTRSGSAPKLAHNNGNEEHLQSITLRSNSTENRGPGISTIIDNEINKPMIYYDDKPKLTNIRPNNNTQEMNLNTEQNYNKNNRPTMDKPYSTERISYEPDHTNWSFNNMPLSYNKRFDDQSELLSQRFNNSTEKPLIINNNEVPSEREYTSINRQLQDHEFKTLEVNNQANNALQPNEHSQSNLPSNMKYKLNSNDTVQRSLNNDKSYYPANFDGNNNFDYNKGFNALYVDSYSSPTKPISDVSNKSYEKDMSHGPYGYNWQGQNITEGSTFKEPLSYSAPQQQSSSVKNNKDQSPDQEVYATNSYNKSPNNQKYLTTYKPAQAPYGNQYGDNVKGDVPDGKPQLQSAKYPGSVESTDLSMDKPINQNVQMRKTTSQFADNKQRSQENAISRPNSDVSLKLFHNFSYVTLINF